MEGFDVLSQSLASEMGMFSTFQIKKWKTGTQGWPVGFGPRQSDPQTPSLTITFLKETEARRGREAHPFPDSEWPPYLLGWPKSPFTGFQKISHKPYSPCLNSVLKLECRKHQSSQRLGDTCCSLDLEGSSYPSPVCGLHLMRVTRQPKASLKVIPL